MEKFIPGTKGFKSQTVIFLISGLVLIVLGYFILHSVEDFFYHRVQAQAKQFAKGYARNLETAMKADSIINSLLAEKILTAGELAVSRESELSSELLTAIALATHVDEIYAYNPQGIIVYSSSGKYIGWKAPEGHPVIRFMHSGELNYVEDIRKDSEADIYYKYGYYRGTGGRFVQIGVLADTINAFLDSFDMQRLLGELSDDPSITYATYLDIDLNPLAYDTAEKLEPLSRHAVDAINADRELVELMPGGQEYRIVLPVFVNEMKSGSLVLQYDVRDTLELVRSMSMLGILLLILLYGLTLIISVLNSRKNKRLSHYAYHQTLTDLPNTRFLQEALKHDGDSGNKEKQALLLVNYRNFKQVNMLFGYQYGEKVISDLAARLRTLCTKDYRLFHLSTDRFAFYVTGYHDRNELSSLCFKIIEALQNALPSKTIGGNVGIVEAAYFKSDLELLLKYAMLAGEHVGTEDPFGFEYYSSEMEAKLQRESDIEQELRDAAAAQLGSGLYLMYQPIISTASGKILHMEALARLKSNKLGEISPTEFIPIAEKTQLIVPLGDNILRMACQFIHTLKQAGHGEVSVSVNISAIQLMRDDFLLNLMRIVRESKVEPACLSIEITESIFAESADRVNIKLGELRKYGVRTAIDDFGTGYSSLAMERDLDVYCLKIDRSFISKLSDYTLEKNITGDIISMAHRLGHEVVAEGVETIRQKEYLERAGCDYMQGYLFSRPLLPADMIALLDKGKRQLEKMVQI